MTENGEGNMKEHRTRKSIDSTAGLVCRRTVGQEQKTRKTKEEGESGPQMPVFDEARRGGLYAGVRDSYETSTLRARWVKGGEGEKRRTQR